MKKLNLHQVEKCLVSSGFRLFRTRNLMSTFEVSKRAAQAFLSYNIGKGAFIRLKPGLFALTSNLPGDFAIANRLYYPSYISLNSALSYYNLIPESVYAVTSVTPKPTREFEVIDRLFDYRRIKRQAFAGYVPKVIDGETVYIATKEKAVADFFYFVFLGKRGYNNRLKLGNLDVSKLKEALALFSQKKLITFVNQFLKK